MTRREIKRKLAEKNIRQVDLAKKWRMKRAVVSQFINGDFTSARLDKRLAKEFGITVEQLRGEQVVSHG